MTAVTGMSIQLAYDRRRYAILFYALLLTLLVLPIATTLGLPPLMIRLFLAVCLATAVMPNSNKHTRLIFLAVIILLSIAGEASARGYLPVSQALILVLVGAIGLIAAAATFRFMIEARSVTAETVYAALSTYLLGGLFFGQIYWSIELLRPGSLVGPDPTSQVRSIYYSFVTLATLGYGDFLPRTDVARGVATFEVVGGQLFLAVLVARLIGAFEGPSRDR
jgi:voltage-gated potassium channel Kch